jgi:tetratricopeptide (TPR) repeat protein
MFHKRTAARLLAVLAVAVVFTFAACEKLSVSKLTSNYHFSKANKLFTENQYRRAIAEYELALKSNPSLTQAYRFLGESYKQLYKPGVDNPENNDKKVKALDALNKALAIEPNNKDIIYSLGDMYDKLRNFKEAEKLYLRIIELEPTNMGNYYVVAEFYKRYAGEDKTAAQKSESMYLRRIETDPDNPQGYAFMANYLENLQSSDAALQLKLYDQGLDYRNRIIALQPGVAEGYCSLGINLWSHAYRFQFLTTDQRLRYSRDAEKALQKAIELDPNYPEPYSWLSVLYRSVMAKLEPEKEGRYNAEADKAMDKFQDLRKRAAERKKLEEELKKTG